MTEFIRTTDFLGNLRSKKVYEYLSLTKDTIYNFDLQIQDCKLNFDLISKTFTEYKCESSENYKKLLDKIFKKIQYVSKDEVKESYAKNFAQLKDMMDKDKDPVTGESNFILITLLNKEMQKSNFWFTMYSLIELEKIGIKSEFMYTNFSDFRFSKDYAKLRAHPKYGKKKLLFLFTDDISYSGEQLVRFNKDYLLNFIQNPTPLNNTTIYLFLNLINVTNRAYNWIKKELNLSRTGVNNKIKKIFPKRLLLPDGTIDKTKYIKNMREILMEIYNEDTTKDSNPLIFPPQSASPFTGLNSADVKSEDEYLLKYIFFNDLYYVSSINNSYIYGSSESSITIKSFFYNFFMKNITHYNQLNPLTQRPSDANFLVTMSYLPFKYADHLSNFQQYCYINLIKALTVDIRKFLNITNNIEMLELFNKYKSSFNIKYDFDKSNTTDVYIFGLINTIKNQIDRLGIFNEDAVKKLEYLKIGFDTCRDNKLIKTIDDGDVRAIVPITGNCDTEIASYRQIKCPKTFYKSLSFDHGPFKFAAGTSFLNNIDDLLNGPIVVYDVKNYHRRINDDASTISYYDIKDYATY